MNKKNIDISYVIVNYNIKEDVLNCIESIKMYTDDNLKYEIIVVDNNSQDGSYELFLQMSEIIYLYQNENFGFGTANNIGVKIAKGRNLIFINPDVVLTEKSHISFLVKTLDTRSDIGLLSTKIMYGDGSLQSIGNEFPTLLNSLLLNLFFWNYRPLKSFRYKFFRERGLRKVGWISGAFFCTTKENFLKVGQFDEKIFLNAEDIELSYKYKLYGFKNYVYDKAEVIHYHGKSKKKTGFNKSVEEYEKSLKSYEYVIKKHNITYFPNIILKLKIFNYALHMKIKKLVLR